MWQHPLWGEFQKAIGRSVFIIDKENASAIIIKHKLPLGLCWLEVPRGPLFKSEEDFDAILKEIKELGKKENAIFIRFSSYKQIRTSSFEFRVSPYDNHPETSLIIDLDQPEEDILNQMKPKGRYNIKVADKHEVVVQPSDDAEAFYDILSKTANRDGFHIHSKNYYITQLNSLGQHVMLLLAKYQDRVIAGGVFVYLDEWGIYYYGASDHHYRNLMAPYLIQWEAIKEAKKRGCKYYDFLGVAPEGAVNHRWAGVTDFKKKFGGKIVDYPKAQVLVLKPFWYFLYKVYKKVR